METKIHFGLNCLCKNPVLLCELEASIYGIRNHTSVEVDDIMVIDQTRLDRLLTV